MAQILFYLFVYPISLLPFWALYALSDFLRLILYHIIGYRVDVIRKNIKNSFPEKSEAERKVIERTFYKHLCDLVVESVKYFSISKAEAERNFTVINAELFHDLYAKGKSVIVVGGHYGCWERLALNATRGIPHKVSALYAPLANEFLDKKMADSRSRFGLHMISIKETKKLFKEIEKQPIAVIFGSDQSPRNPEKAYWLTFLNQETGVQFGAEKLAKEYNCAVVYGQLDKTPRKANSVHFQLICEDANAMPYGKITEMHTKLLEDKIREEPAYWLWSHKRWKRTRPAHVPLH